MRRLEMIVLCLLCLLLTACSNQFAKQEYDSDEKIAQSSDHYAKKASTLAFLKGRQK